MKAGSSFSVALGPAGRQAARRAVHNTKMTPEIMLSGHLGQTARRAAQYDYTIVAQDTTEIDYASHRASKIELGPMGGGERSWGVLAHSCLALSPTGVPLGVVHLDLWTRPILEEPSKHSRKSKSTEEKESIKWRKGLAAAEAALPDQRIIMVADRESDVYDYLAAPRSETTELVLRVTHPRRVTVSGPKGEEVFTTFFDAIGRGRIMGTMEVTIPRKPGQKERIATLELRVQELQVLRPKARKLISNTSSVRYFAVHAVECSVREGKRPVEWYLLTTMEVYTLEEACEVVRLYTKRWQIEVLHRTLKTGLRVERLQIDDKHALLNALAAYFIVAWRILWLTHAGRHHPDDPADKVLEPDEEYLLERLSGRKIRTCGDAVLALATLGGYEHWKGAPPPGPQSIWIGLRRIQDVLLGHLIPRRSDG
jgi:hypothetical protein